MAEPELEAVPSLTGQLLIATPLLGDPNFLRTVVLLVDHDDHGAIGVVLNRPSEIPVVDEVPRLALSVTEPARVFEGGPVQDEVTMALSAARGDGLCSWTVVDQDDPPDLPEPVRIFRGYSGWGPGQLEVEIAEGAWWTARPRPTDLFTAAPSLLWSTVLRREGPPMSYAATWLADPHLN